MAVIDELCGCSAGVDDEDVLCVGELAIYARDFFLLRWRVIRHGEGDSSLDDKSKLRAVGGVALSAK